MRLRCPTCRRDLAVLRWMWIVFGAAVGAVGMTLVQLVRVLAER